MSSTVGVLGKPGHHTIPHRWIYPVWAKTSRKEYLHSEQRRGLEIHLI